MEEFKTGKLIIMIEYCYLYVATKKGKYVAHGFIDKANAIGYNDSIEIEKFDNLEDMVGRLNQLNGVNWYQEVYAKN